MDLGDEIVDLSLDGAHVDLRVGETRRADDLLGDLARARALVLAGCGGNIYDLIYPLLEFLKLQRAVIERRRQAEAILHQRFLAGVVAAVHGPHLWQGDMALIHKQQKILREIIQQGRGHTARGTA